MKLGRVFDMEVATDVGGGLVLQIHGGYGFVEEYDTCKTYRDGRLITIGGGTSEVMKEIIWKLGDWGHR